MAPGRRAMVRSLDEAVDVDGGDAQMAALVPVLRLEGAHIGP